MHALSNAPDSVRSIPVHLPPPIISSPVLGASQPATAVTVVEGPRRGIPTALLAGVGGALVAGLAVFFAVKSTTQSHALSAVAVNKLDTPISGAAPTTGNPTSDATGASTGTYRAPPSAVAGKGPKYTWPPPPKAPKPGQPAAAEEPVGFVQPPAPPEPVAAPAAAPEPVVQQAPVAAVAAPVAAAPVVNTNKPQPFGEGMSRPSPINPSEIKYPREAIESKASGVEIVRCTIGVDGSTSGCRVIKSVPFMDAPVLEALSHHRGTPVMKDGHPVPVEYTFSIKFQAQ